MPDQIEPVSSWLFTKIFEACEEPWRHARTIPPVVVINEAAFPLNEDQQEHLRRVFETPDLYANMRKLSDEMYAETFAREQQYRQQRDQAREATAEAEYGTRIEVPVALADTMRPLVLTEPSLYARGRTDLLEGPPILAIVGSRNADEKALQAARRAAISAGEVGWTIMSGLAKGVDTAALLAALNRGFSTIGVIGTPFTECYPVANASLQRAIEQDHLLLTPHDRKGKGGDHWFPARNKVMAYYADATLLVAAEERSGTRHVVEACAIHCRPLFVLRSVEMWPWLQAARPQIISSPTELLAALSTVERGR